MRATATLSPFSRYLIRQRRKEMGLTMAELARRLGFSRSWLAIIERGLQPPSENALRAMCGELGLHMEVTHQIDIW
jgi:transcriptional regulator with XRE-family HTH domain